MVRIDVDIRNAREPVSPLQLLDDDADVIEDAEARRVRPPRMVQPRDWHETALCAARHQVLDRDQRGADDVACSLEDTLECRRVAGIEESLAGRRAGLDEVDVNGIMEELELAA